MIHAGSGLETTVSHCPGGGAIQGVPLDVLSEDQIDHLEYLSESFNAISRRQILNFFHFINILNLDTRNASLTSHTKHEQIVNQSGASKHDTEKSV